MTLREKKKQATKALLLNIAKKHFLDKGYKGASTAGIAKEAGIGEGTLFNYFGNKGNLYLAALFPEQPKKDLSFSKPKNKTAAKESIISLVRVYLTPMLTMEKDHLREFFMVVMSMDQSGEALAALSSFDQALISHMSQGLGPVAARAAYHHIMILMMEFSLIKEMSLTDFWSQLDLYIDYTLTGHFEEAL